MQNELNERQSKRTPGVRDRERERERWRWTKSKQKATENCGNLRNKQKTLKIAEGEGRKVYAKQQTKQSRQLICWQRKGECPNIYSIYKAGHTGHGTHTEHTGHRTLYMGHGQTISCLLAKKIYVPKDKSLDKQLDKRERGRGRWSNILRFLFN